MLTKKQIVAEVKEDAQEHRVLNDRQEKEDDARVDHAVKELDKENEIAHRADSQIVSALVISIIINFILVALLALLWYFFYKSK